MGGYVQMTQRSRRRPGVLVAALLTCFGLVAAACGGDDGGSSDTTSGGATTTAAGGTATTTAPMEPKPGGKVVMGIEADSGSPWTPAKVTCAISCYMILFSVFDPLVHINEDGEWQPYLAESITPNADYTVWTIKARSGVKFHDGTDLDGAAIADNLIRQTRSALTGAVLATIKGYSPDPNASTVATDGIVVVDPMTVEVRLVSPWVAFPVYLAGQIGAIASPTWLKAADADPSLEPKPVGTGPFVLKEYKPGEGFSATKNPNYWNQPFPYLDEVEFRIIPDALSRKSALQAGDIDLMHTTNGESIKEFRENPDKFPMIEFTKFGETGYTLLNVGDPDSPLSDSRVRCAMANAYDGQAVIDKISAGVPPIANGPFSPGQAGHTASNAYPTKQNMAKAKELVAAWKADNPGKPLEIRLSTTQDQTNLVIAQAQQQFFLEAGFDKVEISQIEQAKYILTALLGDFQAFQWRNHGGVDMDQQFIWWHSLYAAPKGSLALNFGRIRDEAIEAAEAVDGEPTSPARAT